MTTLPQSSHYAMGEGEMVKGQWSKSKGKEERRKGDRRKGVISQPQPNLNFSYFLRVKDKWLKAKGEKVKGGMETGGRETGDEYSNSTFSFTYRAERRTVSRSRKASGMREVKTEGGEELIADN